MFKCTLFLLIFFPFVVFGQVTITGKVTDITTHKPIGYASVILSNSSVGNRTDTTGIFVLRNVKPGQYDLVASIVGYETYQITLMVSNANLTIPPIELLPKSINLQEVIIKPDAEWFRNYEIFKTELLGEGPDSKQCKILNPDVVKLRFDEGKNQLIGSSTDFIEIENRALGYRVKYLLSAFNKDYKKSMIFYEGSVLFEDLPTSSPEQVERYKKARERAYYGSMQHFLKAALHNRAEDDGFKALQMVKIPNPKRPSDEEIKSRMAYFNTIGNFTRSSEDSLYNLERLKRLPKTIFSVVKDPPVYPSMLVKRTNQTGVYVMTYTDYLYVMYTKTLDNSSNSLVYRPTDTPNYSTSILTFSEPRVYFDDNGHIMNPLSIVTEGAWGKNRVSGMLPIDYEPSGPPQ
ncbi:carboxypeptidase-like regulatory domain-containing protein [Mucilaginibacter polytrichastri]|uniref:Carboxypeptidase-like regulatory domain-containing protein n=1 Tax=Mucilaginibacter polytrichastri TaxID=1302689 RepID=A0A1Q6A2K3_9SPHI|nr:carboxypeptidase-like regulatory domain-containing protein [Mucilaginibacter polytrichastri]OKS88240.1 hypothetical protein RG47T_3705 [Mucilaginibacter polytrichastri]